MDCSLPNSPAGFDVAAKACPLCSSESLDCLHDRVWQMEKGKVFRCRSCGLGFVHPTMSEDQEKAFYLAYNEHVKARGVIQGTGPQEFHVRSQPAAQERYTLIRSFFPPGAAVLEIGASTGAFLELLNHCHREGVEPALTNRDFCQGNAEVMYADLAEVPDGRLFDVICMFHVFEHIRFPVPFLRSCKRHLRPGGRIILEVPHIMDPLLSVYDIEEFKDFYFQPMHPYIYSVPALDHCCDQAQLDREQVIYYQRYGLDNHLAWLRNRKPGGDARLSALFGQVPAYSAKLVEAKLTDTIIYIAQG